jgi:hypothetical protein
VTPAVDAGGKGEASQLLDVARVQWGEDKLTAELVGQQLPVTKMGRRTFITLGLSYALLVTPAIQNISRS